MHRPEACSTSSLAAEIVGASGPPWAEGRALWDRVLRATPGRTALVLMPDHVHVLHPHDVKYPLAQALAGHTRAGGPPIEPLPAAQPIADRQKLRRNLRYVHLNPCRAKLCPDPLAWPFSSHRDACRLAVPLVVPPRRQTYEFHRYVSSDPHVRVDGTDLPAVQLPPFDVEAVIFAVSSVTRTPLDALWRIGPARRLLCAAARKLTDAPVSAIAGELGIHRASVYRAHADPDHVEVVRRVMGDPRFAPLAGPVPAR